MIYSFSTPLKREWFPADWYPEKAGDTYQPEDGPAQPIVTFDNGPEYRSGFPLGHSLNELLLFDVEFFMEPKTIDANAVYRKNVEDWIAQECERLREIARKNGRVDSGAGGKGKHPSPLQLDEIDPIVHTVQNLGMIERGQTCITNKAIAKESFKNKIEPSESTLWLLKMLQLFEIDCDRTKEKTELRASARAIEQLSIFITDFSILPAQLQTPQFFRDRCENHLGIAFENCVTPQYEKAAIAVLETALMLLEENPGLNGQRCFVEKGIDLTEWREARRTDLFNLCAATEWSNKANIFNYPRKHILLIRELESFLDILEEVEGLTAGAKARLEDAEWFIRQGIDLCGQINQMVRERNDRFFRVDFGRRPPEPKMDGIAIALPDDARIDAAIAASSILNNTFAVSRIEELIACMAYAVVCQSWTFHNCNECGVPFIKDAGNRQTYCSEHCRQTHMEKKGKQRHITVRQNLQRKAKKKEGNETIPSAYANYFEALIDVINQFSGTYSKGDRALYEAWCTAINSIQNKHLTLENERWIKCVYENRLIDPIFPIIIDNQLCAVSCAISNSGKPKEFKKLLGSLADDLAEPSTYVRLEVLQSGKGNKVITLEELIRYEPNSLEKSKSPQEQSR